MNKTRKILSVVIAFTLVTCSLFVVDAMSLKDNGEMSQIKSYVSVDIYSKINELFKKPNTTYSLVNDSSNLSEGFSDDYAGAYIDDAGNLILQFVVGSKEKYNKIISDAMIFEKIKESENSSMLSLSSKKELADTIVNIEEKNFSYNELMIAKEKITEKFENLGLSVVLTQKTNSIDVYYSESALGEKVKEYVKSELGDEKGKMVNYIYDNNCIEKPSKSAYPGNKIHYNYGFLWLNESYGTIGFNAYYKGKWGVVTNGHVAPSGKKMKCADGTLGTPSFSYIGGKLDVAFIPYPDGWTPTSGLTRDNSSVIYREATTSELIEGGPVEKYGVTTGHTKYGRIVSTSADISVEYDDGVKTIRDTFRYSNPSAGGDSGGPVGFGKVRSVFSLIGIHFAGNGETASGIKLSNIKAAYPMTVKTGY